MYSPKLGRWLSPDPSGVAGGDNLYAYCDDDPINKSDPSGLDPTQPAATQPTTQPAPAKTASFPVYYNSDGPFLTTSVSVVEGARGTSRWAQITVGLSRASEPGAEKGHQWDKWNRLMTEWGRDQQLHAAPGKPTAPNLTMMFNNGYNPDIDKGAPDDQAVVFIRDIRDGQNVTGNALISGIWYAGENKEQVKNKDAEINKITNGPFTVWIPKSGSSSGDWRIWVYYLNNGNTTGGNVVGQYDVIWSLDQGSFSFNIVNHSVDVNNKKSRAYENPSKYFDFDKWRAQAPAAKNRRVPIATLLSLAAS